MSKPVWLLNRFDIEWRWLPNSPWYPTIKLYRQNEADNWDNVIDNVKADLIAILGDTRAIQHPALLLGLIRVLKERG
jgi:hypothetical protein